MVSFLLPFLLTTLKSINIMRRATQRPEINAGSMADIAFLLLIFFLVTAVIPNDTGFNRALPKPCPNGQDCLSNMADRNVLKIAINAKNEIMLNASIVALNEVKPLVMQFIDINGDGSCNYCNGKGAEDASYNPLKAVISLNTDRNTNYQTFIAVQDELTKAYFELRKTYSGNILKKNLDACSVTDMQAIKAAYPFLLSEAETK